MPWPVFEVEAVRYRLRLLNASNARRYALSLDPDPSGTGIPFLQIGADAFLLPAPVPVAEVVLSQSERADVVVDFARVPVGQTVTMHNGLSHGGRGLVMQFRVVRTASDTSRVPDRLGDPVGISERDVVARRQFWFSRVSDANGMAVWAVNGEPFNDTAVAARPRFGTVEEWTIHALNVPHPFHIHAAPFVVMSREGERGASPVDALEGHRRPRQRRECEAAHPV